VQHVVVRRPLDAAEATRVRRLLAGGGTLLCDVRALDADLAAVEALARLRLDARRVGAELHLVGVPAELRDLLRLAGLTERLVG
jgi:anti-anti-sigma regulatory factor